MGSSRTTVSILALVLSLLLAGCTSSPTNDADDQIDDGHGGMEALMAMANQVAADLDTPEKAAAAGYVPDAACIPGMGVHWAKAELLDGELDEEKPEVLMFLPDDANLSDTAGDTFLGIEYVVVTEGTDMNTTATVPSLYGMPFEGPMPGHFPGMPWHAELHVYLAEDLTDEMHHGDHPGVTCPRGTTPAELELLGTARALADGLDTGEEALAAGYAPTSVCDPGMGVHWVKMPIFDTELNLSAPEVLMFEPGPGGIYDTSDVTLAGLEWVVVTEGTEMNTTETVPTLLGIPLDGPMPGHFPGMPWHAELHLWHTSAAAPFGDHHETDGHTYHGHAELACPEGTTTPPMLTADLHAVTPEGVGDAKGNVTIVEGPFLGSLSITVSVEGLPEGKHGVHIHENGDCSPASLGNGPVAAGGAGGHFNPDDADHGEHAGDLGNLEVGADGTGTATFEVPLTLEPNATYSVLDRSLIVHAEEDDGEDAASAGSRVLCGVLSA